MNTSIVLIGPIGVGKTTQANILSKRLGMPLCSYDSVKTKYWREMGLKKEDAEAIEQEKGIYAMLSYMNEFKVKTVTSIIQDFPNHIIDFGGSAQTFDEPDQILAVQQALEPIKNVFLLLPSPNIEESINYLPGLKENLPINAYLVIHPTNKIFSKKIIYTLGKKPEQISDEIIENIETIYN